MRKIAANYIFPVAGPPLKNGIVTIDERGIIHDVTDTGGALREEASLEFYNGIITPGFINAHCHLELSHLKGLVPEHTGLEQFLFKVNDERHFETDIIKAAVGREHRNMIQNGIVAVGDICNTSDSFFVKNNREIQYHSFLEIFGLNASLANKLVEQATTLATLIDKEHPHPWSIVPHAPYSISAELFQLISELVKNRAVTIHNQECEGELQLFKSKKGPLYDFLASFWPFIRDFDTKSGNSLGHSLHYLQKAQKILLVHNTFSTLEDIQLSRMSEPEIFWVCCPNANLYIENKLPDIYAFTGEKQTIALGTDSLSSNQSLSILEEMKTLLDHFKDLTFEEVLQWGTLNGARALNMQSTVGSIEKGKRPGLNLITGADLQKIRTTSKSRVRKLV